MDRPAARIEIREFVGMTQNMDAHDGPEGLAREVVNAESKVPGTLQSRKGFQKVRFAGA